MKKIILLVLSIFSLHCFAGVYMQKNDNGDITYSDVPTSNSQGVTLNSINSLPSTTPAVSEKEVTAPDKALSKNDMTPATTDKHKPYTSFSIASPANNETIQNQPTVTVQIVSDPALQTGDTIQVYMDGQPWGEPSASASITLNNVARGTHTLFAKVFDVTHQTLKQTTTITIFVHRASVNKS